MYDLETREYAKNQEEIISKLEFRIHQSEDSRSGSRDDLMRDYARVLYSSSFRRLQGKMQLLGIDANKFNRNRLTHSLEVAQIARSIAHDLELKNPVVSETASLAHDIGNPPFGHYGEFAIREWFERNLPVLKYHGTPIEELLEEQMREDFYHFEGNAQALRLVSKLHFLVDEFGMNLTYALLNTIVKSFQKSLSL